MPRNRDPEQPLIHHGDGVHHLQRPADDAGAVFVEGVHLKEVANTLRRHLGLVILAASLGAAAAWFWTPRPKVSYTANAAIQILNVRRAMAAGIEDMATDRLGRFADPVQSHIEILRGRVVVGRVVDREGLRVLSLSDSFPTQRLRDVVVDSSAGRDTLHLHFSPGEVSAVSAGGSTASASYGAPLTIEGVRFTVAAPPDVESATLVITSRDRAIDRVAAGVYAFPRKETDLVDVYYTDVNPRRAQRIVNAVVEEHRQWSVEAAQDRSRRRRIFLEEQLRNAEIRLAEAQLALSTFRSSRELYSSRDRLATGQQSLTDLDVKIQELSAERRLYEVLLRELEGPSETQRSRLRALVSAPGLGSNAVVSQLNSQLIRYEMTRDSLTTGSIGHTSQHPNVERLNQLIVSTQASLVDAARTHARLLDERIRAMDGLRARNASEMRVLPQAEAEEMRLTHKMESIRLISDQLRGELQKAEMAEAVEAGQVEIAYFAPVPEGSLSTRRRNRTVFFAAMLGVMMGVGGAFGREAMNTSIRRRNEIEKVLRVQELAVIPRIELAGPRRPWRRLLPSGNGASGRNADGSAAPVHSAAGEAYRTLRTNLSFSPLASALRSLVITSASPLEGKSTTAVNLAYVFASQGKKVLLVDADLRRPRLHEILHVRQDPGLAAVLEGTIAAADAIRATAISGLHLLPSGAPAANPSELLGSARMQQLITDSAAGFEVVIIDSPPILAGSDASILATQVDGAVLVVRAGRTQRAAAEMAMQQLEAVGAVVAGAVLNDPDVEVPKLGDYHYAYGYYAAQKSNGSAR